MRTVAAAMMALAMTCLPSRSAPMYLPVRFPTIRTHPIGEMPACQVRLELDPDLRWISRAVLVVGDQEHHLDAEALRGIERPDLTSLRIEVERGRDGRFWMSMVLTPARHTEHPTRYHITFIDGVFARVSRTWDEPHGTSIARRSEILHREPEREEPGEPGP